MWEVIPGELLREDSTKPKVTVGSLYMEQYCKYQERRFGASCEGNDRPAQEK